MIRDKSIIFGLYKQTKNSDIKWYYTNNTWVCRIKLTNNKSILYEIHHKEDNPYLSYMSINLEKRYYKKNDQLTSDVINIKRIHGTKVMMLLRLILEVSGFEVIKHIVAIIENEDDSDNVLFLKRSSLDKNWVLPGGIMLSGEKPEDTLKRIMSNIGMKVSNYKLLKYRNIFKMRNNYFYVTPYIVEKYDGHPSMKNIWINKYDVFNYYIGPETIKIIRFLNKGDGLPF